MEIKFKKKKIKIIKEKDNSFKVSVYGDLYNISGEKIAKELEKYKSKYPIIEEDMEIENAKFITVESEIVGLISTVQAKKGQYLKKGDLILSISAMKIENEINMPVSGKIKAIYVKANTNVNAGDKLVKIENENI